MESIKAPKKSFLFYESFEEAISQLPDEQALKAYKAIIKYGLYDEEPDLKNDLFLSVLLKMAKPLIDIAMARRENGKKGGKPVTKNENDNQSPNQNNKPVNKKPIEEELPF